MTPRAEIAWIDVDADRETLRSALEECPFSRLLVCEQSVDNTLGMLSIKDVMVPLLRGEELSVRALLAPVLVVPDRASVLQLLDRFRREGTHMAAVVDEYGTTEGVVTLTDVLEAIAGDLPERGEISEPPLTQREDGSWLVDGSFPFDEFVDRFALRGAPETGFLTVAGFVLHRFGHLPGVGESFLCDGLRIEVLDMDGRRIDRILVQRLTESDNAGPSADGA